jgi:RimJ/RimL family protein N-acetyltransferase
VAVKLVPYHPDYAIEMTALLQEEEVHRFLDLPIRSMDACLSQIRQAQAMEALGFAVHRLILNEAGTLVGAISLTEIDPEEGSAFMGTWLGRSYWGQGYNQAAKQAMLQIAFEGLKLERVLFVTPRDHARSLRALGKLGYVRIDVNQDFPDLCKRIEFRLGKAVILSLVTREQWKRKNGSLR